MIKPFYAMLCFFVMTHTAMADGKNDAEKMLECKLDSVISVLQNHDLSINERDERIVEIVSPMFDFSRMAKLTLGKRHWPGLNKKNQERFTELFIKRLKESYREKLTLYTDEKVVYEEAVQVKNKIKIPTYLISKSNKISIIYKFYKSRDKWKIYDLEIQGVSIIQTYRSQFNQILENGTIEDLLLKLEEPVNS